MEMENYIKQDLESPENYINTSGFPFKDPLVSFLPEYTVMPKETLLIRASILFFLGCNPRRALFKDIILLPIRNQDFILTHRRHDQSHIKNKCLWDSSSCLQKTQEGSMGRNLNLSRLRSFPKTTHHKMKLYLGRDHCSQTTLSHEIGEPTSLKKLYARARKGPSPVD